MEIIQNLKEFTKGSWVEKVVWILFLAVLLTAYFGTSYAARTSQNRCSTETSKDSNGDTAKSRDTLTNEELKNQNFLYMHTLRTGYVDKKY